MGRASRRQRHYPRRLGEKLLHIRSALNLSQTGMLDILGTPEGLLGTSISGYERGIREPPLLILLKYAHIAGICLDVLIDDKLDLPEKLPAEPDHSNTQQVFVHKNKRKIKARES